MSESQVTTVIRALRVRIRAMYMLETAGSLVYIRQAAKLQTLYHMLTGIPPWFTGLAALPTVQNWVLAHMIRAGITTLTELLALTPHQFPPDINTGLMKRLQEQARELLEEYPSEDAFVATFIEGLPIIGASSTVPQVA